MTGPPDRRPGDRLGADL